MPDTSRPYADVQALLADNDSGAISPQDLRDAVASLAHPVGVEYTSRSFAYARRCDGLPGDKALQPTITCGRNQYTNFPLDPALVASDLVADPTSNSYVTGNTDWVNPTSYVTDPGYPNAGWLYDCPVAANASLLLPPGIYSSFWSITFTYDTFGFTGNAYVGFDYVVGADGLAPADSLVGTYAAWITPGWGSATLVGQNSHQNYDATTPVGVVTDVNGGWPWQLVLFNASNQALVVQRYFFQITKVG